jgi:HEPN domain-containing protein
MNRQQLQELTEIRLQEARSLLTVGFSDGAYYLAGYSIECAFKACIARRTREHDFPDKRLGNESHTHSLIELLRLSQLASLLEAEIRLDPAMRVRWTVVREWSEASRYERHTVAAAQALLQAVEEDSGGLLPWIRRHW